MSYSVVAEVYYINMGTNRLTSKVFWYTYRKAQNDIKNCTLEL